MIALGIAGYRLIDSPNNSKTQIYNEYSNILEELQNRLVKGEQLNKAEWEEVCNLLHKVKDIQMYDCDSCHDYIRALLGGKHERHLKNYIEKSDKEILKGIKSYQKQIDLHYDKIANPEKHIPNWNNLHPDHRENSQNEKWQEDIARLKEQKRLFECILKNR